MSLWVVSKGRTGTYDTQLIEAESAREAAEKFGCSVLDLERGFGLLVQPFAPTAAFRREYAVKGTVADWWDGHYLRSGEPVTIECPVDGFVPTEPPLLFGKRLREA